MLLFMYVNYVDCLWLVCILNILLTCTFWLGRPTEGGCSDDNAMAFMDFGDDDDDVDIEEVRRRQDEEFDFQAILKKSADKKSDKRATQGDLETFLYTGDASAILQEINLCRQLL